MIKINEYEMSCQINIKDRYPVDFLVTENFDFSGMSDTDYTDTFADIDQAEEEKSIFTAGLRKAVLIRAQTREKKGFIRGSDPAFDSLFVNAVSGSAADGWDVKLKPTPDVIFLNMFGGTSVNIKGFYEICIVLDLASAAAVWAKTAR